MKYAGHWCKRCSRRHTREMGCHGDAPCAICGEPATRRLRMTQLVRDVDYQTGELAAVSRAAFMVPFCADHGVGDPLP